MTSQIHFISTITRLIPRKLCRVVTYKKELSLIKSDDHLMRQLNLYCQPRDLATLYFNTNPKSRALNK